MDASTVAELVGRKVSFQVKDTDTVLTGEVTFVSPSGIPFPGQVRLWATVANPRGIIGAGTAGTLVVEQ